MTSIACAPGARPRARGLEEAVGVDGEVLVAAAGEVHVLTPTAALLWECCDGEATVAELSAEVAEVFDQEQEQVLSEVVVLVGELEQRGLVVLEGSGQGPREPALLAPSASCASCGEGPGFEATVHVELGSVVASIGADATTARAIERAFGGRVVERAEATGPPLYGIVLPEARSGARSTPLARLHRGEEVLCTSRDPGRIVRALAAQLAIHALPARAVRLDSLVVGRAGRAVLVPVPPRRSAFLRRLAAVGCCAADVPSACVDPAPSAYALVGAAQLALDLTSLLEVAAARRLLDGEPPALPWGNYEIVAVATSGDPSPASVLAELVPLRHGAGDSEAAAAVPVLLELLDAVPILTAHDLDGIAGILT
ncbi:MAG: PqqD family protein [Actinobacteria bacterium]|nr:PqqD family protein [Actinomycetota bacterium]